MVACMGETTMSDAERVSWVMKTWIKGLLDTKTMENWTDDYRAFYFQPLYRRPTVENTGNVLKRQAGVLFISLFPVFSFIISFRYSLCCQLIQQLVPGFIYSSVIYSVSIHPVVLFVCFNPLSHSLMNSFMDSHFILYFILFLFALISHFSFPHCVDW